MKEVKAQYPGLYLFTSPSRLMRPVKQLGRNKIEMIGTLEQLYMNICIRANEAYPGVSLYDFYMSAFNSCISSH